VDRAEAKRRELNNAARTPVGDSAQILSRDWTVTRKLR
jgi:hypothetical protein